MKAGVMEADATVVDVTVADVTVADATVADVTVADATVADVMKDVEVIMKLINYNFVFMKNLLTSTKALLTIPE